MYTVSCFIPPSFSSSSSSSRSSGLDHTFHSRSLPTHVVNVSFVQERNKVPPFLRDHPGLRLWKQVTLFQTRFTRWGVFCNEERTLNWYLAEEIMPDSGPQACKLNSEIYANVSLLVRREKIVKKVNSSWMLHLKLHIQNTYFRIIVLSIMQAYVPPTLGTFYVLPVLFYFFTVWYFAR